MSKKSKKEIEFEKAKNNLAKAIAENPHLKDQMDELVEKIDKIEKAKGANCPTCGQTLTEDHRNEMVALWTQEGGELGDQYRANQAEIKQSEKTVSSLEKEIVNFAAEEKIMRTSIGVPVSFCGQG